MLWPIETIKDLILQAQTLGESEVELASQKEAELFRYAINNVRKNHKLGQNVTTRLINRRVIILKRPEVKRNDEIAS